MMKRIKPLLLFMLLILPLTAFAQEPTIFDIRKPLAMSNGQKVHKDFFINAGTESGIKPGVVITVTRRRSLYDAYQNKSPGDIMIPIGKLKIIHSQKGLSVGRLYSHFSRDQLPTLDYPAMMVGDRLDMGTMRMLRKKKKKTASFKPQKIRQQERGPIYGPLMSVDFASRLPDKQDDVKIPSRQ